MIDIRAARADTDAYRAALARKGAEQDFDALMEGKASDPSAWPSEFRITAEARPGMQDIGKGHLVRAA